MVRTLYKQNTGLIYNQKITMMFDLIFLIKSKNANIYKTVQSISKTYYVFLDEILLIILLFNNMIT